MTQHAAGDAAGPAGRGLADLRALPRRHRLGDHAPRTPARVGEDAHLHRRFLADFYAGEFPGTFARGARFQPDPRTGEARTSGTRRVAGRARGGAGAGDASRWSSRSGASCCCTRVAFAHGGLPLIYMGDELGLRNDPAWARRPRARATTTAGCTARRWTGRRPSAATTRRTVEGRLWAGLRRLVAARRAHPRDPRPGRTRAAVDRQRPRLRRCCREQAGERLLVLANFTPLEQAVHAGVARDRGFRADARAAAGPTAARSSLARRLPRARALPVPLDRLDASRPGS